MCDGEKCKSKLNESLFFVFLHRKMTKLIIKKQINSADRQTAAALRSTSLFTCSASRTPSDLYEHRLHSQDNKNSLIVK